MLHRKHVSKSLIDCLSNVGLCSPYFETTLFEASIVKNPVNIDISKESFIQFVFDNADHNTSILDGRKTFHAMGGILAVTPFSGATTVANINKLKKLPSAKETVESFSFLPITTADFNLSGLQNISIKEIDYSNCSINVSSLDLLWLHKKICLRYKRKGGFHFAKHILK